MEEMNQNFSNYVDNPVMERNSVFSKVFSWMFIGLLITGVSAYYVYASGLWLTLFTSNIIYLSMILELVLVFAVSYSLSRLSTTAATILFAIYSAVNGVNLSSIFAIYEINSMGIILLETSLLFGVLALIGHNTKIDVTKWGNILMIALLVSLVASIINIFIGSETFDLAVTWITLLIFGGFTIYDIKKIELLINSGYDEKRVAIYGALQLYLDFINIFIKLLRLYGRRRD